jgi:hypothetical protein
MRARSSRTELGCCCRSSTKLEVDWHEEKIAVMKRAPPAPVSISANTAFLHLAGFFLGRINTLLFLVAAQRFAFFQLGTQLLIVPTATCPGLARAAACARWAGIALALLAAAIGFRRAALAGLAARGA